MKALKWTVRFMCFSIIVVSTTACLDSGVIASDDLSLLSECEKNGLVCDYFPPEIYVPYQSVNDIYQSPSGDVQADREASVAEYLQFKFDSYQYYVDREIDQASSNAPGICGANYHLSRELGSIAVTDVFEVEPGRYNYEVELTCVLGQPPAPSPSPSPSPALPAGNI